MKKKKKKNKYFAPSAKHKSIQIYGSKFEIDPNSSLLTLNVE
jgi:hypothetical protein